MAFLAAVPAAIGTLTAASTASTAAIASASLTLAEASATAAGVGAAVTGYSQYKNAQFQGAVAKNNANIAAQNQQSSLLEGQVQESNSKQATAMRIGAALAAQGANGVDVGFGSPTAVRQGLQSEGDLDAATIRYNASRQALNYANQQAGFTADAQLDKNQAGFALGSAAVNVGASYIGGASSVSSKYLAYKTAGTPTGASYIGG